MKQRSTLRFLGIVFALLLIAVIVFRIQRDSSDLAADPTSKSTPEVAKIAGAPESQESGKGSSNPPALNEAVATLDANSQTTPAVTSAPESLSVDPDVATAEVQATRRMVAAHAPLRDPRVADPDSVENQRILQAMIFKGLKKSDFAADPVPPTTDPTP